jgi:hypothetical protein
MSARAAWYLALACALAHYATPAGAQAWLGANVKRAPSAPWHSAVAADSIAALRDAGANAVAIVVFLWQPQPVSSSIARAGDISDIELAAAIRVARRIGLRVLVKPHAWVPGHWAGDVPPPDAELARWFARYRNELERIARIAQIEGAGALAIGTELKQLAARPEGEAVILGVRRYFRGTLTYVASSLDEAEQFAHWSALDAVAASLYPPAPSLSAWVTAVQRQGERLAALAQQHGRPAWVAELGVRSMAGALAAPWASPEERAGPIDLTLQAQALPAARAVLTKDGAIDAFFLWCWYTEPDSGGPTDADFTVQNKPVLATLFKRSAAGRAALP